MSTVTTDIPGFTHSDRLGLSVFSSFLLHMVIILGITFAFPKLRDLEGLPNLEITLVQTQTEQAPDKADYLAQANQDGGGNSETPDIVRKPLPVQEISDVDNPLPVHQPAPQTPTRTEQEIMDLLALDQAERQIRSLDPQPEQQDPALAALSPGLLNTADIEFERAQLNAEMDRRWQEFQQRPKRKYVNARTREYKYAAYHEAWRAKVERVGQLNYPEEALRRGLSGRLLLDVAINTDGSVNSVTIRQSSGHKLLDDAAVRIVALAAPFAPFPPDIRAETDIMHITRYWLLNKNGWTSD